MRPELDAAFLGQHPIKHCGTRNSRPEEKRSVRLVRFAWNVLP